ncbi:MAG: YeeE/YedE family protein [Actinomycetota bacterium]|nr:YeeE/YedE family protein [Actinomycetota bacterium]
MSTREKLAGLAIGAVFGVGLSWSGMTSPEVIRDGLLFRSPYLFEFFAAALFTATAGQWLLRRRGARALLTGQPIGWTPERPQRRHVVGSALFGLGWGVADACPGPVVTQVAQGIPYALFTIAGVVGGVWQYHRRAAGTDVRDVEAAPQPAESRQEYAGA